MRLAKVIIRNFRCYKDEVCFQTDNLTALVGANDAGKSAILEALAMFFEEQAPDDKDASLDGVKDDMCIACEFTEVPARLVIDATSSTTLEQERLLNSHGNLEIHKIYKGSLKKPTPKIFIKAVHPLGQNVNDLLKLKNPELKARAREVEADLSGVSLKVNSELREAIRNAVADLNEQEQMLEIDTLPGAKELFPRIQEALPSFFLFKADRSSTDQDSEVQDPMKVAVKLAIEQQSEQLSSIALVVEQQLRELAEQTLGKIRAMAPEIAEELQPEISPPKWDSIFKIALSSDSQIPLNKRGSGIRRLVLLGFLQAQVESHRIAKPRSGVIYAIEEPETSQHPDKQRALLKALHDISIEDGFQVLVTTHNPTLARLLPDTALRYVEVSKDTGKRAVLPGSEETMRKVVRALGVLPDHDVRIFVGVEGPNDEAFLKAISSMLSAVHNDVAAFEDLESTGHLVFVPTGGSNVSAWVSRLHGLHKPEFYIFDRDNQPPANPHYSVEADTINARDDCTAVHTSKRELENYLHADAINLARREVSLSAIEDFDDVPKLVAEAIHTASDSTTAWVDLDTEKQKSKTSHAKRWLNTEAAKHMTHTMLLERDPANELLGWLRQITSAARS